MWAAKKFDENLQIAYSISNNAQLSRHMDTGVSVGLGDIEVDTDTQQYAED